MTPTLSTSMAKTAAPMGVPKRAEKPAAMPAMVIIRSVAVIQMQQLPQLVAHAAANLQRRPLSAGAAAGQVGEDGGDEDERALARDVGLSGNSRTQARMNSVPPSLSMLRM